MEQQLQQERIVIENDDEIEIDLKDLVLEILSFWKWVLFALIIGAVTAYCISRFVMVPQYESTDRKSTRLNSSHSRKSRMPSSA